MLRPSLGNPHLLCYATYRNAIAQGTAGVVGEAHTIKVLRSKFMHIPLIYHILFPRVWNTSQGRLSSQDLVLHLSILAAGPMVIPTLRTFMYLLKSNMHPYFERLKIKANVY